MSMDATDKGAHEGGKELLAEVVLSSSPSSQLVAGFSRCHARPRMRDSNEIMPALVFKYENAHIEFLITHTIELKLFRDYSKAWPGWIYSVDYLHAHGQFVRASGRRGCGAAPAPAGLAVARRPARVAMALGALHPLTA